mmetsp:Transcript_93332/g.273240  ORF Transcript_93332/g.273240 Transcript_93332/m.273240 type:complete len:209 (+) Transcript_93332:160-786(+)
MRGWHLELLVHLGAEVLVQELLELLVLLLHGDGVVDRLAPLLQELVVLLKKCIQGLPDAEVHVWDHVAHPLPELALLTAPSGLAVGLALAAKLLGPRLLLLVRSNVRNVQRVLLRHEVPQQVQHVIRIYHEGLVILILAMVESANEQINVLLAVHAYVPQQRVDLQHVALLRRFQGRDLLAYLEIKQELRLLLDQVEDLLHLRGRVLA